jgi:NAD(P)H-hydrate repair Nnr-like enzyme with NAD(P)H-hydrate dehydratase domain
VLRLSEEFRAVTVLKGAGSLVKAPAGEVWRNTSGNPGMAAPGMGDVLAGIIAALIAQGMAAEAAAIVGVWLHGATADLAVEEGLGPRGLTASELLPRVRRLLNST